MQYIQTAENNPELRRVYFHLVDATDGITPEAGEAGGQPTISVNGRTPGNTVNTLVAVDASKGNYYLELSTTEIVNPCHLLLHYKSANTAHFAQQIQVMAFDPYTQFGILGGGGVDVDYKRIQKMITEAVSSIPKVEIKDPEKFDYETLAKGFEATIREVQSIHIPATDLGPIQKSIQAVQSEVKAIKIPEVNLDPVMERIDVSISITEGLIDDVKDENKQSAERIEKAVVKEVSEVCKEMDEVKKRIDKAPVLVIEGKKEDKEGKRKSVLEEYLKQS